MLSTDVTLITKSKGLLPYTGNKQVEIQLSKQSSMLADVLVNSKEYNLSIVELPFQLKKPVVKLGKLQVGQGTIGDKTIVLESNPDNDLVLVSNNKFEIGQAIYQQSTIVGFVTKSNKVTSAEKVFQELDQEDLQKEFFQVGGDNGERNSEENVLISETIIEGWENTPEGRKLELAAYDSMSIKPGSIVNKQKINQDLNAIYASGWFSDVKINSQDDPLGVRLILSVLY